jgi:uroporphyrinogen decarboxylase
MLKLHHNDANVEPFAERLVETGFEILNFSHNVDIADLYRRIGHKVALMGNVPPLQVLAEGTPSEVEAWAERCIRGTDGRVLLSAGGGTSGGTSAENIDTLVRTARGR